MLNTGTQPQFSPAEIALVGGDSGHRALVTLDEERRILYWSPKAVEILGWEAGEVEGREFLPLLLPGKLTEVGSLHARLFGGGREYALSGRTAEPTVFRKDGTEVAVQLNGVPIAINLRRRMCIFIQELTNGDWVDQRHRIQTAITNIIARSPKTDKALQQILAAFCHRTPWVFGAFWKIDPEGKWVQCALSEIRIPQEMEKFAERTRNLMIEKGKSLPGRVWASEEVEWMTDIAERDFFIRKAEAKEAGLKTAFGIPVMKKNRFYGVFEFFARENLAPNADFLALVHSLSGQLSEFFVLKDAEERAAKFSMLVEESNDFIAIFNHEFQVLYLNRAAKRLGGSDDNEAETLKHIRDFIIEKEPAETLEILKQVTSQGSWRGELRFRSFETGKTIPVSCNLFVLKEKESQLVAMVASDLTELKEREDRLHQSRKMEALGRLAGGIAHDFNNLLTAIIGYSDMLVGALDGDETNLEFATEIRRAGESASSLTRQLLTYSRKQETRTKNLVLNDTVSNMETMLKRLIGETVELEARTDSNLWAARLDPTQLEQIILNLSLNARDAMPMGGKLILETRNLALDEKNARLIPDLKPGPYVVLKVEDNGVGMSPDILSRLFEPFFTTKKAGDGTGLGLSMVYGIVHQSDGAIKVESRPGKGTVFNLYFPAYPQENTGDEHEAIAGSGLVRTGETILLAEDEEMVRSFIRRALESRGYSVLEASNGREALELEREFPGPLHLMVTDLIMPETNGMELADEIKRRRPGIRILCVSGYSPDSFIANNMKEGELEFLGKPFNAETLLDRVGRLMEKVNKTSEKN